MRSFAAVRLTAVAAMTLACAACGAILQATDEPTRYAPVGPADAPVRIAYEESGRGEPLLLIHGFGASTYTWRHLVPLLDEHNRVIAVDMKGFGMSDKPLDDKYALVDQAELMAEFIVKLGLRNATVVGHSFGGGVALLLALDKRPELQGRIRRLVILSGVAYRQNIPVFFRILRAPSMAQLGMILVPPEIQAQAALRIAYEDNTKATYEDAAAYARPLRTEGGRHALIRTAQQILPENLDQIAAQYRTIRMPVLLLWCDKDKIVPLEIGWRLKAALPNAIFHMLHECGHMPQEEVPRETARRIREFLDR